MIQAIIFDVGGVLLRTEDRSYRRRWEEKLGLDDWGADEIVFNSEMGVQAQTGLVTEETHWQWVGEHLGLSPAELSQFRQDFWAGDRLDEALVAYIGRLQGRYQTAIISNAMDGLRHSLTHTYPIAQFFDLIVVSAEEKVMKPKPEIYQRTLARLGRQPHEAVFIDDFRHNVLAARELGMTAVHFSPDLNLPHELEKMGVL
ncbi:MAG: HAD family phosphatase [Chloroflexota bacterium]